MKLSPTESNGSTQLPRHFRFNDRVTQLRTTASLPPLTGGNSYSDTDDEPQDGETRDSFMAHILALGWIVRYLSEPARALVLNTKSCSRHIRPEFKKTILPRAIDERFAQRSDVKLTQQTNKQT